MDTNPTLHSLRGAIQQAALALAHCRWQEREADKVLAAAAGGGPTPPPPTPTLASLATTAPDDAMLLQCEVMAATLTARTTFEAFLATWLAHAVANPNLRDGREVVDAFAQLPEVVDACYYHSPFGGNVLARLRELKSPAEEREVVIDHRLDGW